LKKGITTMPKKKKPARTRPQRLVEQALADVEKLELDLKKVKKALKMMPHSPVYGPKCPWRIGDIGIPGKRF